MASNASLPRLVSLACHDIRTPLATASGFAGTLVRMGGQTEQAERFLGMIEGAAAEIDAILDGLNLVARIEDGRYEPALARVNTSRIAQVATTEVGPEHVRVLGEGAEVMADVEAAERGLAALVRCALRHGGIEQVELVLDGRAIELSPLERDAAAVIGGTELRDLGAAVARRAIEAGGGSMRIEDARLVVTFPV